MIIKLNEFSILIFLSSFMNIITKEKIIFSWQIHSHGAKAPFYGLINNTDIYKEYWNISSGELSDVGKRMLYLLGVKVRQRYIINNDDFLSNEYNPQEIFIRSTDTNITIDSIESFLQGLYPHGTGKKIKKQVYTDKNRIYPPNKFYKKEFENITNLYNLDNNNFSLPYGMSIEPFHAFYKQNHEFEFYDKNICKGIKKTYEQQQKSIEIKNFAEKLLIDFGYMIYDIEKTKNNKILSNYWILYNYTDTFICDDADARDFQLLFNKYNFNNDKYNLYKNYSKEFLWLYYTNIIYPKGNKILSNNISIAANSNTMNSIINWMEKAINCSENNINYLKFVVYSADNSSISLLEHFMEYAFGTTIDFYEFAESRFLELYIDDNNKYKVRYLKGNLEEKLNIDYEEFKKIINDKTWDDDNISEFCQFDSIKEESNKKSLSVALLIVLIITNITFLVILIFIWVKK